MFKKVLKNEINVPFINLYLLKRAAKFEIYIAFTKKTELFRNVSVKITRTFNFPL